MSNTDTTNTTRHCVDCDAPAGPIGHKCAKCYDRSDNSDLTHELALVEDMLRRGKHSLDKVYNGYAYSYDRRMKAERDITDGGDHRIEGLWDKLWDALSGDIDQDGTWEIFMDAIPGMPDLRTKMFEVDIPLETITLTVQAKDEDEAIEMAMELAENDYSLEDVIYQPYIRVHEA